MNPSRRDLLALAAGACGAAAGLRAHAQSAPATAAAFPGRPVTIIVPYPPGGITDGAARLVAAGLADLWKQPVLVDNRTGGGATIGARDTAKAAPDGHTIMLTSFGHVMNQILVKNLPYDAQSLVPLNMVGLASNVLYLHPSVPPSTVAELVAWGKANPGKLTFASSGNASSPHIAAELFASVTGVNMVHVPYRGTAPAMADVLGGQVSGIFDTMQSMPYVKSGKLKAIAVTSRQRLPSAPDLPTFAEAGFPAMDIASWFGFYAPAAVPQAVQQQIATAIDRVLASADTKRKLVGLGLEPSTDTSTPAFRAFVNNELTRWTALSRERNIRLD